MFQNLVDYVIDVQVGRHVAAVRAAAVLVTLLLLVVGSARIRLYTLWVWLTLLPASLFTWPIVARYEYLAAIGFSLLVVELLVALAGALGRVVTCRVAATVAALVLAAVVVRSAVFADKMVETFQRTAEPFRAFLTAFQQEHPTPPSGVIETSVPVPQGLSPVYLEAAVQLTFDDPTIRLVFTPRTY